ncbi:MAG: trigger factor [Candidatus Promineifilaceae bacterium]
MTLTIRKEEDDKRQLSVTVEVAEERVNKAMRETARKLAREVTIPGFRKGKVPYAVILKRFGETAVRAEAAEDMVNEVYSEVMAGLGQHELPYAQPTFDNMELDPLTFTFTIPLAPEVKLGEYRELRKDVEPVEITEEAVEEALENLQASFAELESVERAAETGDVVVISGKGTLLPKPAEDDEASEKAEDESEDGRTLFNEDSLEILLDSEKTFVGTPFVENIIGLEAGQEKSFDFTFADDYDDESMAGRQAHFDVTVLEVKKRTLPPMDDELAKLDGRFETLEELRQNIRESLQRQAEDEANNDLIESMIDDLLENATLVYPPAALEEELNDIVDSFKDQVQRSGWTWEDYLRLQGDTEESVRERFRETAETRLKRRLVLQEFVKNEKLTVSEDEIDALVNERVANMGDNPELQESMKNFYKQGYGLEMISSEVIMNKVADRIKAILRGEAPDLSAIEEAEALATEEEE